jgi:hypothetical protein
VFYVHGVWADPLLQEPPPDFIDAEKAYVEGCALLVVARDDLAVQLRQANARFGRGRLAANHETQDHEGATKKKCRSSLRRRLRALRAFVVNAPLER